MRKTRDDPQKIRIPLDMNRYSFAHVLRYHQGLRITRDKTEILAIMWNGKDATRGPVWYGGEDVESIRALCARAIGGVVGRVEAGNRWGLVGWGWGLQETIMEGMVNPHYES